MFKIFFRDFMMLVACVSSSMLMAQQPFPSFNPPPTSQPTVQPRQNVLTPESFKQRVNEINQQNESAQQMNQPQPEAFQAPAASPVQAPNNPQPTTNMAQPSTTSEQIVTETPPSTPVNANNPTGLSTQPAPPPMPQKSNLSPLKKMAPTTVVPPAQQKNQIYTGFQAPNPTGTQQSKPIWNIRY